MNSWFLWQMLGNYAIHWSYGLWDVVLQNCIISQYLSSFYLDLPADDICSIHMILPYLIIKVAIAVFEMNVTLMTFLYNLRKLYYFTNLDFPEIRPFVGGFPYYPAIWGEVVWGWGRYNERRLNLQRHMACTRQVEKKKQRNKAIILHIDHPLESPTMAK